MSRRNHQRLGLLAWPLYLLCAVLAAVYAPSWETAVLYGLPTWAGGALFTLLLQDVLRWLRRRQASPPAP